MPSLALNRFLDATPVPGERAQMGRIAGVLWMTAAVFALLATFLPGAQHGPLGWVVALAIVVFLYGLGSVTGVIPWYRASINGLGIGVAVTIPVVALAIYLTGGALSYIEPLLVCTLLYVTFFFPPRWAWPLVLELILVAATPLLYDDGATEYAYLPRFAVLAGVFLATTWMMVGLKHRLVAAEARQREAAHRDPLTGVGNRRSFDATMRRELRRRLEPRGRRSADASPLALLVIDLDDFKWINDHLGHQAGDAALRQVADRAASMLRSTDTLARIGGDEFAVIAPGAHGEGARRMAESIRTGVGMVEPGGGIPVPSASIGWAVFPEDGDDYESLMRCADRRMLELKVRGRAGQLSRAAAPRSRARPAAG
ncbi:MAG: GGDEF domain-containing protein [Solirubrobacterales bacterium]